MGYSNHDKLEWTLILALEFGRRFGLTLKQSFNYLSHFKGIDFIDRHYDYCHTQSFQSMVNDITEYCHRKGGALIPIANDRVGVQLWKFETRTIDLPTLVHNLRNMKGITFQYYFGTERALKILKRV